MVEIISVLVVMFNGEVIQLWFKFNGCSLSRDGFFAIVVTLKRLPKDRVPGFLLMVLYFLPISSFLLG